MPWEVEKTEPTQLDSKRIAVLPFVNMSPDPSDEYFSDGLTEELIGRLSHVKGLEVIARTSVMNYKNKNAGEIGRELRAGTLVEGSVRKVGIKIRVTVQLINANTEGHLWSSSYDRDLQDIFGVQRDIAKNVSKSLKLKLVDVKKRMKEKEPSSQAHVEYLQGLYTLHQFDDEKGIRRAIGHFERAIQLEPTYSAAMSEISFCYSLMGYFAYDRPEIALPKAEKIALEALELDESASEAHASIGVVNFYFYGNWEKAIEEFQQAIDLNPNFLDAHLDYALCLGNLGRSEEALSEMRKALELDPISSWTLSLAGVIEFMAGDYSRSLEYAMKAVGMAPDSASIISDYGAMLVRTGRIDEGIREIERAVALSSNSPFFKASLGWAYALVGRREDAVRMIDELRAISQERSVSYMIAGIYVELGEKDETLNWLEKAYEEHSIITNNLFTVDPSFFKLHGEPRFKELVRKLGLEKYQN